MVQRAVDCLLPGDRVLLNGLGATFVMRGWHPYEEGHMLVVWVTGDNRVSFDSLYPSHMVEQIDSRTGRKMRFTDAIRKAWNK